MKWWSHKLGSKMHADAIQEQSVLLSNEVSYCRLCGNYQGVLQSITVVPYVSARCRLSALSSLTERACIYRLDEKFDVRALSDDEPQPSNKLLLMLHQLVGDLSGVRTKDHRRWNFVVYVEVVYNELQKKFAKSSSNISINTNRHVCCWV